MKRDEFISVALSIIVLTAVAIMAIAVINGLFPSPEQWYDRNADEYRARYEVCIQRDQFTLEQCVALAAQR